MKKFNVGIQLYGVRNSMSQDFEGTLKAIRDMGYEYVEFAGYYGKTSAEIKKILDDLGLKCISVHQSLDFFNDDPQGAVDFLKGFGVKYVVVPWYEVDQLAGNPAWEDTVKLFRERADLFAKNGMMLGYHNHDFEFIKMENGQYGLDYMYDTIPADLLQTELDTCWVNVGGENPADFIRKYAGRCPVVHLKDFYKEGHAAGMYELIGIEKKEEAKGTFEFRPVGHGMQDMPAIIEAAEESGAKWLVVEQDRSVGRTPMEAVQMSIEYLKG